MGRIGAEIGTDPFEALRDASRWRTACAGSLCSGVSQCVHAVAIGAQSGSQRTGNTQRWTHERTAVTAVLTPSSAVHALSTAAPIAIIPAAMDPSQPQPPQPISYEQSAALTFHHTDYLLHASVRYTQPSSGANAAAALGPASPALATSAAAAASTPYAHAPPTPILVIEAEQRDNGNRWTGEFSAKCQSRQTRHSA